MLERFSAMAAVLRSSSRSSSTASTIPGRRTLTTTSRPLFSSAAWICAIDALASGRSSIDTKCSSPMSSAITSRSGSNGSACTSSTSSAELVDVHVGQQVRP